MPIVTSQQYILGLLDGLVWPAGMVGVDPLQAYVTPPDPEVQNTIPHAYVWPGHGNESRNPERGGTIPRAASYGAPSGLKVQTHAMEVYLVWFCENNDPQADTLWPGMVDAVMSVLRYSPDPTAQETDPWVTTTKSYLIDVGEVMSYEVTVRATADEVYNRYDALITCEINEVFAA